MQAVLVATVVLVVTAGVLLLVVKSHLIVVSPNQVAVISGRMSRRADGSTVGYRIVGAGRTLLIPFLEQVTWLDLTNLVVTAKLPGLYSKRGRVDLEYVANVKIAGHEPLVFNAVERFLSMSRTQIQAVAAQTLEGILRQVTAQLDPDDFRDTDLVTATLMAESGHDFSKLGLVLDSLKIHVEVAADSPAATAVAAPEVAPAVASPPPGSAPEASAATRPDASASAPPSDRPPWARGE